MRLPLALLALLTLPRTVEADRYEATVAVRPRGGMARVPDAGVETAVMVPSGGGSVALLWGVRDWLDVGADLGAAMLRPAHYDMARLTVRGTPAAGALDRVTRVAQFQLGATLRLGVSWIPTVHVGIGVGARHRSAARLGIPTGNGTPELRIPDGQDAELGVDLLATGRVGLDRRLDRRWTVGVSVGATEHFGLGMPDLQLVDVLVGVGYSWYGLR